MALPCYSMARKWNTVNTLVFIGLSDYWNIADPNSAKHTAITFDFLRRSQGFCEVVRKLHCRPAFHAGDFADQAYRIEAGIAAGIATAEIVGQQSTPTGAKTNATARSPLAPIIKVGGAAKILSSDAARQSPAKIRVQTKYVVDVKSIGGNNK